MAGYGLNKEDHLSTVLQKNLTPNGQYRVYVGLKMGVGEANKLAKYIAENVYADVNVDALADSAVEKVIIE